MNYQCRICLEDDNIEQLVAPCNCNGTSKYVHPNCLNEWRKENINTNFFNVCIDCREKYVYNIDTKEDCFINIYNISYIYYILLGVLTICLGSFDNNKSIEAFESIKNKNITEYLDSSNYYYIFYYIVLSNYLSNCVFFLFSWYTFIKIVNKKKYISQLYFYKLLIFFNTWYIYLLYIIFNFKLFLITSVFFLFINNYYDYLFLVNHNNILTILNTENIKYRNDYNNEYENDEQININ